LTLRLQQISPVLHVEERFLADNVGAAGHGHEEIRRPFAASRMGITLKPSITASIAFIGSISVTITSAPRPFRAHCNALSAPAVACDHNVLFRLR